MGLLFRVSDGIFRKLLPDAKWNPNLVSCLTVVLSIPFSMLKRPGKIALLSLIMLLDSFDGYLARNRGENNYVVDYICDRASELIIFINQPALFLFAVINCVLVAMKLLWERFPRPLPLRLFYLLWLISPYGL